MNIFVIGATGYIGEAAVQALSDQGHEVTALVRDAGTALDGPDLTLVVGDLGTPDSWDPPLNACDGVLYAAAGQSEAYAKMEAQAIAHILATLERRGVETGRRLPFVKVSGSMVFGDTGAEGISGEAGFHPPPPLQGAAELARTIGSASGTHVRTVQVFASFVYGHGGGAIPMTLLGTSRQHEAGIYVGDGAARWSMVHVDDVGTLLALALEHDAAEGHLFPVDTVMSTKQIATALAKALDSDATKSLTMDEAQEALGFFAIPLTLNQVFDAGDARALGWEPDGPGWLESLREEYGV